MTSTSYVAQRFMWRPPRNAHKDGSITADQRHIIVESRVRVRDSGCLGSQVQQAAKRTNVRAYLIRRNISFIAALPIEKQCFHHFLAVWITNGFQRCAPAPRRDLLVDPAFDLLLH